MKKLAVLILCFFTFSFYAQNGVVLGVNHSGSYQSPVNKLDAIIGYKWWFIQPSIIYSLEHNSEGRNDLLHSLGLRADIYFQKKQWGIRPFARIELTTQIHAFKQNQMIGEDFAFGLNWRTQSWAITSNNPYNMRYFFGREVYSFMASIGAEARIKNTLIQAGIGLWNLKYSYYIWTYHFDNSGNVVLDNRMDKIHHYKDMLMFQVGIVQVFPLKKKSNS